MSTELLLSIDQFNKPKTVSGVEAEALLVQTLFMMKRGSHPLHPNMGFEAQRYRIKDIEENALNIQNDFRAHCTEYLPNIYIDGMEIKRTGEKTLFIGIAIANTNNQTKSSFVFKLKEENGILLSEILN